MESPIALELSSVWQAGLKYAALGLGGLLLFLLLLWSIIALRILRRTKGLPQALNGFFAAIASGKLDAAYAMTTPAYRNQLSRRDFAQFIKRHRLGQYKTSQLSAPLTEDGFQRLNITAELKSGAKVPLSFLFKREGDRWEIEQLVQVEDARQ